MTSRQGPRCGRRAEPFELRDVRGDVHSNSNIGMQGGAGMNITPAETNATITGPGGGQNQMEVDIIQTLDVDPNEWPAPYAGNVTASDILTPA